MIKIYCDKCTNEITAANSTRVGKINIGSGKYEVSVDPYIELVEPERRRDSRIEIPEQHHICFHCRLDALKALDKRPRAHETEDERPGHC